MPKEIHITAARLQQDIPAAEASVDDALRALVGVSGDILRVHGELAEIGRETAGLDLHECPAHARRWPPKLEAVG